MESISSQYYPQMLAQACESFGIDLDTPFEELPEEHQEIILNGTDDLFHFHYENDFGGVRDVETTFEGVLKNIERRYHDTNSDFTREQMRLYMTELTCQTCKGYRLNPKLYLFKSMERISGKQMSCLFKSSRFLLKLNVI